VAGLILQKESVKVIDLALQLGYESPEAFSKAFQVMHGVTPSQAKKANTELKVLPPMTFQLTIKGGLEMNYRVVEKDGFYIVGFKKRITMQFKGINTQMDSLVQKLTPQVIDELKGFCDVEPKGILSVSANFDERTTEGSQLDQYVGVATSRAASNGYDILHVAASTWAVFKVVGMFPDAIQDTWSQIYAEWFPASGYELTGGPELLWNETPDTSSPDYKSEIWIPVHKIDG
ncbi:MAG TPA: AraC family transcriptional regulator, partial [Clostridium sp.]|nr:AraC family transcriptional regulator [Clostridium sp.]